MDSSVYNAERWTIGWSTYAKRRCSAPTTQAKPFSELFKLGERHRSCGSINLLSIYRITTHDSKNENAQARERCIQLAVSSMNSVLCFYIFSHSLCAYIRRPRDVVLMYSIIQTDIVFKVIWGTGTQLSSIKDRRMGCA